MKLFKVFLFMVLLSSCSDKKELVHLDFQEYLEENNVDLENDVIACAASKKNDPTTSFVFYYPIPGATDIKYFETDNTDVNPNDYSLYNEVDLPMEDVFNGYLQRFVKKSEKEVWCIVSYRVGEKLRTSNPIRLKNKTKPTEWTDAVTIDFNQNVNPKFIWNDGVYTDNEIYFEVIASETNDLLSGTYTYDKWFQYYKLDNVVLNVTRDTPPVLLLNNSYNFTMMGVSIDNWVNLVIQKDFQIK